MRDNIVSLTAKEHFIAHLLLTKMVEGKARSKMCLALHAMCRHNQHQENRHIVSATQYARIRKMLSESYRGTNHHNYGKKLSREEIERREATTRLNRLTKPQAKRSQKFRDEASLRNKGKTIPQHIRDKISASTKGKCGGNTNEGKHYYNDGVKNYIRKECPEGCVEGRLNTDKQNSFKPSQDQIDRMIATRKINDLSRPKKIQSQETKDKISKANKGRKMSDECRRKNSEARKGLPGRNNNQGKHFYNNGIRNYLLKECPKGCTPGRI